MTERRRTPLLFQSGSPAYHRIMEAVEEGLGSIGDRMEARFDRIEHRIDRIERDLADGERDAATLKGEFQELRRDLGELRDAATHGGDKDVAAVAISVAPAPRPIWQTAWGRAVAIAVGFTAIVVALGNVPDAVRAVDRFWTMLRNEPPAVVRPLREEKRP